MSYCAVCGAEGDWCVRCVLDGRVVDFCDDHGIPFWGQRACAKPVVDGLSCALPEGHEGICRRVYRDLAAAGRRTQ